MDREAPEVELSSVRLIPPRLPSLFVESRVDEVFVWMMTHPSSDDRGVVYGVGLIRDVVADELQQRNRFRAIEWNSGKKQISGS